MAFIDEFADLLPDTVLAVPGNNDGFGGFAASGAVLTMSARIEGMQRLVRTPDGQQAVSNFQVYLGGYYGLTTQYHRYYLPSRYVPSGDLAAVAIQVVCDESGPVNEVIYLP